eukprot:c24243_g2_i1 orf=383-817(+)
MASPFSFWQYTNELRNPVKSWEDQNWDLVASKLAFVEQMRTKSNSNAATEPKRANNDTKPVKGKVKQKAEQAKTKILNQKPMNGDWKSVSTGSKTSILNGVPDGNENTALQSANAVDKRFKSLPPSESLPRNETLGGYIFVCNN